jgi:hypothetical protein
MNCENWDAGTATIQSCNKEYSPSQTPGSLFSGHFAIAFTYAVDGKRYSGKFYSSQEWEKDAEVPILYNPQSPSEACVCDDAESPMTKAILCVLDILGNSM